MPHREEHKAELSGKRRWSRQVEEEDKYLELVMTPITMPKETESDLTGGSSSHLERCRDGRSLA